MDFQEHIGTRVALDDAEDGTIIRARTTPELFAQVGPDQRLLTYREIVRQRVAAFLKLVEKFPDLNRIDELEFPREVFELMAEVHIHMAENVPEFCIWMDRFTSSTNMIQGESTVLFWDHQIPAAEVQAGVEKGLVDGGFDYGPLIPRAEAEAYETLDLETYRAARGGSMQFEEWSEHPVFSAAIGNDFQNRNYSRAAHALSHGGFHKLGESSGWVPGGFPTGYGRPLAAGKEEATFYPPNNSTLNHAGIVVQAAA